MKPGVPRAPSWGTARGTLGRACKTNTRMKNLATLVPRRGRPDARPSSPRPLRLLLERGGPTTSPPPRASTHPGASTAKNKVWRFQKSLQRTAPETDWRLKCGGIPNQTSLNKRYGRPIPLPTLHHYMPEYEAEDVIPWGKKNTMIIQPEAAGDPARTPEDRGCELSRRLRAAGPTTMS